MLELVERYSAAFPRFTPSASGLLGDGDVVLLTGSTGSLGSNILASLLQSPRVLLIYCLSEKI